MKLHLQIEINRPQWTRNWSRRRKLIVALGLALLLLPTLYVVASDSFSDAIATWRRRWRSGGVVSACDSATARCAAASSKRPRARLSPARISASSGSSAGSQPYFVAIHLGGRLQPCLRVRACES